MENIILVRSLLIGCMAIALSSSAAVGDQANEKKTVQARKFEFVYAGAVTALQPGASARVWLPVASSDAEQDVAVKQISLPADYQETTEQTYRNRLIYFEAVADEQGEIPFEVRYTVERREVVASRARLEDAVIRELFLRPSSYVPNDVKLTRQLLGEGKFGALSHMEQAQLIYNAVDGHMRYDKPEGGQWGRGDALWACGSGFGNCTDFHSLFIAACRTQGIPCRFEIGFPIPDEPTGSGSVGGYHCWAKFLANDRWFPVDISEADKHPELKDYYFGNLTADRVLFTVGRDLPLEPPTDTNVNYLIYPHVEVAGKLHSSFRKAFRYRSVGSKSQIKVRR